MQINGVPNKFEIYQDYYYVKNGEVITYGEALKLFSQMDDEEKSNFEKYYQDETGYEVITPDGYNLDVVINKDNRAKNSSHYINLKYTLDAYAKSRGLIVDSEWAQFSAEEIIQMENEGVNIPQDVIDIAHTIYESTGVNMAETDAEDGDAEATTEKEPFLDLIPKAEKKIKKCNENTEKIDEKITELLPEKNRQEKSVSDKLKDQKKSLDEYEEFVREWRKLQNKVNNGEELSDTEARRYAEITGKLNENSKSQDGGFELDKREIAKSLNEINILAVLGEKLANETIEIGDTLADYTSKSNYKATKKQVSGQTGFLRAIIAMAQGKNLAVEAGRIGNETKDYTEDTNTSVMNIAQIMEVENSIANSNGTTTQEDAQAAEDQKQLQETTENEQSSEASPENKAETTENAAAAQTNDTQEDDFIITDESIAKLIDEAGIINDDLKKQIAFALASTQTAKSDKDFTKTASDKVNKLVKEFNKEEEIRQTEIKKREEENTQAEAEIEKATTEPEEKDPATENAADDAIKEQTVQQHKETIAQNNKEIEGIKAASTEARETFKSQTADEKAILNESIPAEDEAFNVNTEYKNTLIPAYKEALDFTSNSGITLARMGAYMFEMGLKESMGLFISRRAMWLMEAGKNSMAIGAQAQAEAAKPYLENATKTTTEAEALTGEVLTEMTNIDGQITSITGDDSAATPASDAKASEQQQENEQTAQSPATQNENSIEGQTTGAAAQITTPAPQAEQAATATTVQPAVAQTSVQPKASVEPVAVTEEQDPVKKEAENNKAAKIQEETQNIAENKPQEALENIQNNRETENQVPKTKSTPKEKEELTTDKAQDNVDDANESAADDSKDSEKVLKDTEKDEKQLEKEAKKIQKQMQKDQKDIIKMTKESERAAKKQEEALVEFEELVTTNEQLIAEDENKKQNSQPANNTQQGQQGEMATNAFTINNGGNDNTQQLQSNDARISVLNTEFKLNGKVITRNNTKIKKLQKTTKVNQKKFDKKVKIRETKIKEAEKKEQEKQKRLAKQLGAVGIAENVFSITLSTGMILMLSPFTAAAGAVMVDIGTYGVIACGVTKATINMANGNWTAALMGLGQTAITAAMSLTGTGAAAGGVLGAVSAGLNVVASSAELVNNVRAVQGKEASGIFSKIATIAGVASSVASSASTLQNLGNTTSTFGKAAQIAGVVGTALSSTSQVMTEFGADGKAAQILGMVGGAVSMAASVAQLAQKFSGASSKNEENKEKVEDKKNEENTENTEKTEKSDKTEKTKEQKEAEKKAKKEEAKQAKEQKKAEEKQQKEAQKQQRKAEKEAKKQELKDAKQAKKDKQQEAKGIKNKDQKKNMLENGSSAYYSDKTDADLQAELATIEKSTPIGATSIAADKIRQELRNRETYRGQMAALDAHSQQRRERTETIMNAIGSGVDVVSRAMASGQNPNQDNGKKKGRPRQWTSEEMKRVNRYKKLRQLQQAHASNYRYSA